MWSNPLNRRYHFDGDLPSNGEIFVFGSNTHGRHGLGAALAAKVLFAARWGVGEGLTGKSYAIPTKTQNADSEVLFPRTLPEINISVQNFVAFTRDNPQLFFFVTNVGCGKAGFMPVQIAPMFVNAINCSFPNHWEAILENGLWPY